MHTLLRETRTERTTSRKHLRVIEVSTLPLELHRQDTSETPHRSNSLYAGRTLATPGVRIRKLTSSLDT